MARSRSTSDEPAKWKRLIWTLWNWLLRGAWWLRTLKLLISSILLLYLAAGSFFFGLRFVDPPTTAVQVQRRLESTLSGRPYTKQMHFVSLSDISPHLRHAVVAAEDGRFYQHNGIDWLELEKVLEESVERGHLWRGGSTITQQLIKNLLFSTHFGFLRKAGEFALVPVAEGALTKDRILELYLNLIEWGDGIYGAEAAARFYYQIPAARLSREQSARLAACIPAPRSRRPERMGEYASEILRRMEMMGW